ncbi:type II toxin-antitoxin system RelE/ParE family toxin [Thalassobaculum sp.]|uniref:type II toxin-antitoxin system RelE/ParE family toxin n=1 Tax=Thalassobaculum sp. TaxID=2022740 RepID=UPI003B5B72BA
MARYRVSRKAQSDIREIGLYTQHHWGADQRRTYLSGMETRFQQLAANPDLAPLRAEFRPPVRLSRYERHLIVYLDEPDGVLIVRVVHERMDLPDQLSDR